MQARENGLFSGGLRYEDSNTDGTSIFMQGGTPEVSIK